MTALVKVIRLMFRQFFGEDKDVAKRELFDADHDPYLRYLDHVRRDPMGHENAISAALLERSRE